MSEWEVRVRDDDGAESVVGAYPDRVEALAHALARTASRARWVTGPDGPALRTNRDLYDRLLGYGDAMKEAGRTLDEFLRAWWMVSAPAAGWDRIDLDTVAAMVGAAAIVEPPPFRESWRTGSYPWVEDQETYAAWEVTVVSQIADLAELPELGPEAYYGVDVDRPPGVVRATGIRWYNFTPRSYLECGAAGSLGGWDPEGDDRVAVPGPVVSLVGEPPPGEREIVTLGWDDLAELARCGQEYE
jgi:hypothetical protein